MILLAAVAVLAVFPFLFGIHVAVHGAIAIVIAAVVWLLCVIVALGKG